MMLLATPQDTYAQKKSAKTTQTTKKQSGRTSKQTTKTKQTTKKKVLSRSEYEKQQKELQKRISETEKMISDNDKSVIAQSRDIKLREQEIGHREALLVAMHKEIEAIAYEEDSLQQVIKDLQDSFESKKEKYGMAMRHFYKTRSGYSELLFILSSNSMIESVRRMRYLRQYSDWRKQQAIELEQQRQATAEAKDELSKTRQEREVVLENLNNEKVALSKKKQQQELALANLKKRGKELHAELEKDQKQHADIQKKIQQMIDEERRKAAEEERKRLAAEKKKQEEEARKKAAANKSKESASAGKSQTQTPKTTSPDASKASASSSSSGSSLTGGFRQNKGRLPYPVDTGFAYLRHYKEKNDGNVSISLSTAVGANACAVFNGVVLRCSRSSDDYTVIIKHGDYMSVYSNLSSVSVKEGQAVKSRQKIGKVKSDVDGRRGELMFWIYGKTDAENPETWLKR